MGHAVIFPKLGQTMEEGAIVKWLKKEGDTVAKGDILFEIETDKANLEVESFFEGVLLKIYVTENITVPVNTVVGYVGAQGEKAPPQPAMAAPAAKPETATVAPAPQKPQPEAKKTVTPIAAPAVSPVQSALPPPVAPPVAKRLVISPRAKALAHASAINPDSIVGSGPNNRIVEKDVRAWLAEHNYDTLRITPAAKQMAVKNGIDILRIRGSGDSGKIMVDDIERAIKSKPVALTRMRQVIARRLVESKQSIPHFYVTVKVDVSDLLQYRIELKEQGKNYTLNDFILQAVVIALEEFPVLNSVTDGTSISWRSEVDLGVAVSVEKGLVVPVLCSAQTLTMSEMQQSVRELAERARTGKLTPDEMVGSSFTVSNMGMMKVDQFTAIINPGEAAILAVSTAKQTPAVVNGEIKIRTLMAITLSADHRIVDGSMGALFVNAIKDKLENIALWSSLT